MNAHRSHILTLLLLTTALGLASCRDTHNELPEPDYSTHLRVIVRVNGDRSELTRADGPNGGEEGDGRNPGEANENRVNNATLLLYKDNAGINSTADPVILHAFYAPKLTADASGKVYTSDVLKYEMPMGEGTYHIIALVNMGDKTALKGKKLSDVRNMTVTEPYTLTYNATTGVPDIKNAANFVMTSATDATINILGDGGPKNVKNVTATVERLAARIDFSPGPLANATTPQDKTHAEWKEDRTLPLAAGGTVTCSGYEYVVVNSETKDATADRYLMTAVTPVNCLSSGTYSIKRVTNGTDPADLIYLGDETADATHSATNYVIDPWTTGKTTGATPDGLGFRNPLESEKVKLESKLWPVKHTDMFTPTVANAAGVDYYILDYTQENTLTATGDKERFATGLQIDGYYGYWDEGTSSLKYIPRSFRCYIRHADPTNTAPEDAPMKYGIVRNNIYRIHIKWVNSLGQIQIEVQAWNPIKVDEITL